MKFLVPLVFFVFGAFGVNSQVSFEKSNVIHKSFVMSRPLMTFVNEEMYLISTGTLTSNKIVVNRFDADLQVNQESVYDLDKGQKCEEIFMFNERVYLLIQAVNNAVFELREFDFESLQLLAPAYTFNLENVPDRAKIEGYIISERLEGLLAIEFRNNGLGYINIPYNQVFVLDGTLQKLLWSFHVEKPVLKDYGNHGYTATEDMHLVDSNTLLVRYKLFRSERNGFRTGPPMEFITRLFHYDGSEVSQVWEKIVAANVENPEKLPKNTTYESLPIAYFDSKTSDVTAYSLSANSDLKTITFNKYLNDTVPVERHILQVPFEGVDYIRYFSIYNDFMPVAEDHHNGVFIFDLHQFLKRGIETSEEKKASTVSQTIIVELENGTLKQVTSLPVGKPKSIWDVVDGRIFFNGLMDYIEDGEFVKIDPNDVFDRYLSKHGSANFHYLVNGEMYSMHTEYSTTNMTSQIVKWKF